MRDTFNKDISEIEPEEVKELLKPQSVVADRINARKSVKASKSKILVTKGMKYKKEEILASDLGDDVETNPNIGFRCL